MFSVRLILLSGLCWLVHCDLLDLYVQHMDETMKTMAYRKRHHPRDLSRRFGRSLPEEPFLRVGTFKKQRLDVDEDWWRRSKGKIVPYKEDGLDFPNANEENLEPGQYEVLKNQTRNVDQDSEGSTTVVENLTEKPPDTNLEFNFAGENLSFEDEKIAEGSEVEELEENVTTQENEVDEIQDLVPEGPVSLESMEEEKFEDGEVEIIEGTMDGPVGKPSLKGTPKPRSRAPKKYFPASGKSFKDFRGFKSPIAEEIGDNRLRSAGENDLPLEEDKSSGCREARVAVDEDDGNRSERAKRNAGETVFTRHERLDDDGEVFLEWDPSDEEIIIFRVTAKTLGYVGIGFNEKSHMKGADILLAWVDDHTGAVNLLDSHGIEETNAAPVTDASQDVRVISGSQNDTHTTITFARSWQTCDPQDHRLTGDTIRVLWAMHQADPELNTAHWHGNKRGGRALRLKAPAPHPPPRKTQDVLHWDVKLNQFAVSGNMDTVYWCKIFKAPPWNKKHHMIGYTPLVEKANEGLVHHVILYECASTSPILGQHARISGAPCYSPTMPREWESCLQPVLAWARGSKGEWMPEHVGIPIGEHREGSYYMLEVHYNNPGLKKVIDSSGVRLHLTPKLRPQEAGILIAGVAVSPLHLVPPRQKEYATAGYCTPHCTNTMFPADGINIVSVVLHSHLAGRRLGLKHIRQGKELPRIVQDNHFDFEYQQSHTLEKEVKVLPGDELVAECVYGTLDRSKPTLGGYAASQEMCLAFVVHYPRTPLAACYSMTPVKELFRTLGVYSFKGVTIDHLEKLFLTTGTDSVTLPSMAQKQLPIYPATRPSENVDEDLIREAESALRAMRDYTHEQDNDNVFARLIIEEPEEFRGRTFAEHILALPWTEELLARPIEKSLYHGRHMTFCRKRDDKLALPADIQTFPNFTALPEVNDTSCSDRRIASGSAGFRHFLPTTFVIVALISMTVF